MSKPKNSRITVHVLNPLFETGLVNENVIPNAIPKSTKYLAKVLGLSFKEVIL